MSNEFITRKGLISLENVKSKQYKYYEYNPLLTYNIGDGIERNNEELYCREDNVTGTFNLSKWNRKGTDEHYDITSSYAAYLDGRFSYINTQQKFQTTFQNDFTIEFFTKLDDGQPAATQTFIGVNDGSSDNLVHIYILTTGVIGARYIDGSSNDVHARTATAVFANGESAETKIKATFSETNGIKIYVDDVEQTLDGSYPGTPGSVDFSTFVNTTLDVYIGARNNNGTIAEYLAGQIFDFKIRDNNNSLVVLYPFAEGYGAKHFDVSGNSYHAISNLNDVWHKWDVNSSPTATGTTTKGANYAYTFAFDTDLTIDGAYLDNCWLSDDSNVTNQRLVVDLGSSTIIKRIRISNSHDSGSNDDTGVKTTAVYVSDNASDYTGVYGTNTAQTQIWSGIVSKHSASDIKEFFKLDLDVNYQSGRYLIFEFADNWGDATNMGVRRIEINSDGISNQDSYHYNAGYGHNINVATFNGSSEYIDTNQTFQSTFQNDFIFEAVILPDDGQPAANQYIFGAVNSDDSDEFSVFLDTSGDINATFTANTNTATAKGGITLSNGAQTKPFRIKVVCNSSTLQVFMNDVEGTAASTAAITFSEYSSSQNPYIGAQNDNDSATGFFDGKIWNVSVYDNTPSLDAFYPLGDGSGTAIIDTIGTNGTANASTIWGNTSQIRKEKVPVLFDLSSDVYGSASESSYYFFGDNDSESYTLQKNGTINQYIINSEEDFPLNEEGDKYILSTGIYIINDSITVTKPIDKDRSSFLTYIRGASPGNCVINSSINNLFEIPYLVGNLGIKDLCISSPSGSVFDVDNPAGTGSLIIEDCYFDDCLTLGTIEGVSFINRFVRYQDCGQGFTLKDNNSCVIIQVGCRDWKNSASCVYYAFEGAHERIQISGNDIKTAGANESIFDFDSSMTTDGVQAYGNVFDITDGGAYFAGSSKTQTDDYFRFDNNIGIADSFVTTQIDIGSNAQTTSIPVASARVLINANTWSDSLSEKITVDSNGVATYTGNSDIRLDIYAMLSMEPAAGTNKNLRLRAINIHAHDSYTVTFTNATNTINETSTALSNGDAIIFYNTAGTLPAELRADVVYYVVNKATNSFQVSYTSGGAAVEFTDDGTPTNSYNVTDIIGLPGTINTDAGASIMNTTMAIVDMETNDQIGFTVTNTTDANDVDVTSGGAKILRA